MLKLMSPRFRVSFVGSVSSQRIIAVFCNVNLELEFEFHGNILAVDIGKFASEQTGGWGVGVKFVSKFQNGLTEKSEDREGERL